MANGGGMGVRWCGHQPRKLVLAGCTLVKHPSSLADPWADRNPAISNSFIIIIITQARIFVISYLIT